MKYSSRRCGRVGVLAVLMTLLATSAFSQGGATTNAGRKLPLVIFKELIPGFGTRGEEVLRDRSAVYWPNAINAPLLILQGGADWRVDPRTNGLALAQKLQEAGKTYELTVYAGDDHGLSLNTVDADRRVITWSRRHMR